MSGENEKKPELGDFGGETSLPEGLPSDPEASYDPDRTALYGEDTSIFADDSEPGSDSEQSDEDTASLPQVAHRFDTRHLRFASYSLIKLLGRGGVGEIWEAYQESLHRTVAVKQLSFSIRQKSDSGGQGSHTSSFEYIFHQEALAAAQLDHPNIVPIYDLTVDENDQPQLAMKMVRGKPWKVLLQEDLATMPMTDYLAKHLQVLIGVAQAVAFVHSRGIVHRDLKPAQVMVGEFGEVYLMDWGLAIVYDPDLLGEAYHLAKDNLLPTTRTASSPAGTVAYMAPEQTLKSAEKVGPWTDVFLLGATLYYILTGTPPHDNPNSTEAFRLASMCLIQSPSKRLPKREIPHELTELAMRAMSRESEARPASVKDFIAELRDYITGASRRRDSVALIQELKADLEKDLDGYRSLADLLNKLENARALWPENPDCMPLREQLLVHYAETALNNGDLVLAQVQADRLPASDRRSELLKRIQFEDNRVRTHARQRLVAFTAVGLLGIMAFALAFIANNRAIQATDAKAQAEKAREAEEIAHRAEAIARGEAVTRARAAEYGQYLSNIQFAQTCLADGRLVAARQYLGETPESLRHWEWGFLMNGCEVDLGTLFGHEKKVNLVEFSPDGTRLLSCARDWTAIVWEVATGQRLVTLQGHKENVGHACFSPDGKRVATFSDDKTAKVWDAGTGTELMTLAGHTNNVTFGEYNPQQTRIVTASTDNTLKVWDAETGTELHTLAGHTDSVIKTEFASDGRRLLSGAEDGDVRLWDVETGECLLVFEGHTSGVTFVHFGPDEKRLISSSLDQTARVWDVATGECLLVLAGHSGVVLDAEISPDGRQILTGSMDHTAKIWDAYSGAELQTLASHTAGVKHSRYNHDGSLILTTSMDNQSMIWNAKTGREMNTLTGHTDWVYWGAFSPDGTLAATASRDHTIMLWKTYPGGAFAHLTGHHGQISSLDVASDGKRLLASSYDNTASVWELATGRRLAVLEDHTWSIRQSEFSPSGKLVATASYDKTAKIWNADSGRVLRTLEGHAAALTDIHFSPDEKWVLTSSADNTIKVWKVETGDLVRTLEGHTDQVSDFKISADGSLIISASKDRTARLWSFESGETLAVLQHADAIGIAQFSPDADHVVTVSADSTARLWSVPDGVLESTLIGHQDTVLDARFNQDGTRLVTCSNDGTARVWEVETGKELMTLTGHAGEVTNAWFSPDGARIVTGSHDSTAKVWDASTGRELVTLAGHKGSVDCIAFGTDGRDIITGSEDGTMNIWRARSWKTRPGFEDEKTTWNIAVASTTVTPSKAAAPQGETESNDQTKEQMRETFFSVFGHILGENAVQPLEPGDQELIPEGADLRIVVLMPSHLTDKTLHITGNHEAIGNWEVNQVAMNFLEEGPHGNFYEIRLPYVKPLIFKLTYGNKGDGWTGTGEWAGPPNRELPHQDTLIFKTGENEYTILSQFGVPPTRELKLHQPPRTWMVHHELAGAGLQVDHQKNAQEILTALTTDIARNDDLTSGQIRAKLMGALQAYDLRSLGIATPPDVFFLAEIVGPDWRPLDVEQQREALESHKTMRLIGLIDEAASDKQVFIVGDKAAIGEWVPNTIELNPTRITSDGHHVWELELPAQPMEFKLTYGKRGDGWTGTQEWAGEPNRLLPSEHSTVYLTPEGELVMVCKFGFQIEGTGVVP